MSGASEQDREDSIWSSVAAARVHARSQDLGSARLSPPPPWVQRSRGLSERMAKWLNKYFSLGNNKTKSPLRPDYHDKRDGASSTSGSDGLHYHYCILPGFLHHHLCGNTSDLLCAYHAQKDRDFEDPYSRPGSSLCKLCAVYHLDYYVPENLDEAAPKAFSSSCCARTSMLSAATPIGSPRLFHSHSKNQLALLPNIKYTSSEHHLIKVESGCSHAPDSAASMVTWSSLGSVAKKLNKGLEQLKTPAPPTKKEKVSIADDYSDPFDAKSELNKMGKGEDTGYMEPYEAQRIMTGICFIWADWTQSGSHKTSTVLRAYNSMSTIHRSLVRDLAENPRI